MAQGTVKRFTAQNGFGFVTPASGGPDQGPQAEQVRAP